MRSLVLTVVICVLTTANLPDTHGNKTTVDIPTVDECCEDFQLYSTHEIINGCIKSQSITIDELVSCEMYNCILENVGITGTDDKINKTQVENVLNEIYKDEWAEMERDSVQTCLAELKIVKSPCEARSFSICFMEKSIKNCPEKRWRNTIQCNKLRMYVNKLC
ncbi:uncharacterized protein LOC143918218 [Arctopsyche grandis]|uniref:uncharacterized protein LOC143918218 n=1 Tax=Arctopsyche grandis TaxID=121162 RepID=UPI00406D9157